MVRKPRVLFVVNGPFNENLRNYNYYQRCLFLSRHFDLTISLRAGCEVSTEISRSSRLVASRSNGKRGHFLHLIAHIWMLRAYDIVITEPSSFALFGFLAKVIYKRIWISDVWDIPFRNFGESILSRLKNKFQLLIFRHVLRWADLSIVSIMPDFQLRQFRLPIDKSRFYTNAILLDEYVNLPTVEPFEIFTVLVQRSLFVKGFGLEYMLAAFSTLLEKMDANLLIVGDVEGNLRQALSASEVQGRVKWTGFVSHAKFVELALRSHVCAIPFPKTEDLEQTYPIKAIEYMALGKAVVATNIEGTARLIGDAGILVDPESPDSMAEAILSLHKNPSLREELGKKASERSRRFDALEKNERIIEELQTQLNMHV